jgi:succinoglycan biosynthesis protein ExoA
MQTRVALVMPMLDEAAHLPATLASLARQTIAHSRLFFIAVDGGSADESAAIVRDWLAATGIRGDVIVNPRRRIPISLNMGIRHAGPSDIIVRLDAHTIYGATYVADVVAVLESDRPRLGCVGGAQIPARSERFEQAVVGELLTHPLGLARLGVRDFDQPMDVETVYLGAWPPGVIQELGGFDEAWIANEDSEFEARLRASGRTLVMVPSENRYIVNRGILATIKQWSAYGFWRAQTTRRFPHELRARHLIPAVLLLLAIALLFTPWWWFDIVVYLSYAAAVLALRDEAMPIVVGLGACVAFPLFISAWTLGFVRGLFARPPDFARAIERS